MFGLHVGSDDQLVEHSSVLLGQAIAQQPANKSLVLFDAHGRPPGLSNLYSSLWLAMLITLPSSPRTKHPGAAWTLCRGYAAYNATFTSRCTVLLAETETSRRCPWK
jgi:hypothetical protein